MVFVDAYLVAVFVVVYLVVGLCRGLSSLIGKVGAMRELPVPELRKIFWSHADEKVMGEKHRTDAQLGLRPSFVKLHTQDSNICMNQTQSVEEKLSPCAAAMSAKADVHPTHRLEVASPEDKP